MTTLEIDFTGPKATPYIMDRETTVYECDGKEGSLRFNGYFYVKDEPTEYSDYLPMKMYLIMRRVEKEPWKVEGGTQYFKTVEEHMYSVEIYRRVTHDDTSQYGPVDIGTEEDPDIQDVCFFPTCWQTIYFRVLEEL
jgi:hypothetical protein